MTIRGERSWCPRCQAPEVFPENLPILGLFIDLLPSYRVPGAMGAATLQEGFDRAALIGMMDLHEIAPERRAELWEAVREMESELRRIRSKEAKNES